METAYLIGALTSVFVLAIQSAMLGLQAKALQKHGHRSFLLLAIASFLGILYCLVSLPMYLIHLDEDIFWMLTFGGAALTVAGGLLGLIGTILLFNSYAELAEQARQASKSNT